MTDATLRGSATPAASEDAEASESISSGDEDSAEEAMRLEREDVDGGCAPTDVPVAPRGSGDGEGSATAGGAGPADDATRGSAEVVGGLCRQHEAMEAAIARLLVRVDAAEAAEVAAKGVAEAAEARIAALEGKVAALDAAEENRKRPRESEGEGDGEPPPKKAKAGEACPDCGLVVKSMKRHKYDKHRGVVYKCTDDNCTYETTRKGNRARHVASKHAE
jgi:hypothetical protein